MTQEQLVIRGKELHDLISQGHKIIPTQWIEVDKNSHLKQSGEYKGPEFKSRLVACGQFEDASDLRTDSPTCDVEGLNLILALAAARTNRIQSADVRNAYFQGKKLERVLLLKPPRGGLPGEEDISDAVIKANVPIYGTKDAGRMFWKRMREVIIGAGMRPNKHIKALYTLEVDGVVKVMLATHVDDLMWTADPDYEHVVRKGLETFDIREVEQGEFRFCGRER